MSALSDLVNKGLARRGRSDWSLRALEAHVDERLSHGSIAKYRNGTHGVPDEETLDVLSDLTGISVERLRRAAGLPEGQREVYQPPVESARLDRRQRRALDELIRSFVTAQEEHDDASQEQGSEEGSAEIAEPPAIGEQERRDMQGWLGHDSGTVAQSPEAVADGDDISTEGNSGDAVKKRPA